MNQQTKYRWLSIWLALLSTVSGCNPGSTVSLPGGVFLFGHVDERLPGAAGLDTVRNSDHAKVWIEASGDTTYTDAQGDWMLTTLPASTNDITIQKDGFSYWEAFGLACVGGPVSTPPVTLQWRDTQFVRIDSITHDSNWGTRIWLTIGDSLISNFHSQFGVLAISRSRQLLSEGFDSAEAFYFNSWQLASYSKFFGFALSSANFAYGRDDLSSGDSVYVEFAECANYTDVYNPRRSRFEYPLHGKPSNMVGIVVR